MQEYSLIAQIPAESHHQVLQQCAGVSRMQPQAVEELHLFFKAKSPAGLTETQKSSGGGSQGVVAPEVQKTRAMLNTSLYYLQLVGTAQQNPRSAEKYDVNGNTADDGDVVMANSDIQEVKTDQLKWVLEFRDTPDPGKQPVTSRLLYKIPILEGDVVKFVKDFGFEYVSCYVVRGHKFYDQDLTLFLRRIMQISTLEDDASSTNITVMPNIKDLVPLNNSDEYVLSATIESVDGSNADLRERALRQLLLMKETLKAAVTLIPGDRLAQDTKVPVMAGQRR